MGTYSGPKLTVTDRDVFCHLDAAHPRSYNGSSTWYDLSGHGNHGTLFNAPTKDTSDGIGCLTFNGVDEYASVPAYLKNYSSFTFWYKMIDTSTSNQRIAEYGASLNGSNYINGVITEYYSNNTSTEIWAYSLSGGTRNDFHPIYYASTYSTNANQNYPASTGEWRNITWVFNGGTGTIYVDGKIEGSESTPYYDFDNATTKAPWYLGAARPYRATAGATLTPNGYGNVKINSFTAWSRALTADEVDQNFKAQRGRYGL
jgi:hypothetical protein